MPGGAQRAQAGGAGGGENQDRRMVMLCRAHDRHVTETWRQPVRMSAMRKLWLSSRGSRWAATCWTSPSASSSAPPSRPSSSRWSATSSCSSWPRLFGKTDFARSSKAVNGTPIFYGAFLTDLLNFVLLAACLFLMVKFIVFVGVDQGRRSATRLCPYCMERIDRERADVQVLRAAAGRGAAEAGPRRPAPEAQRARRKIPLPPLPRCVGKDKDVPASSDPPGS